MDEKDWRRKLSPAQYHVCRERGTEPPFSGEYLDDKSDGIYQCACCGADLFDSRTKFDSGSGWPSFHAALDNDNVAEEVDLSHGMRRVEVHCRRCGCHLGHVFPDGPQPTGLRYCINSLSLSKRPR